MAKKRTKTDRLLGTIRSQSQIKTPIATEMFVPNYSGVDHAIKGNYLQIDGSNAIVNIDIGTYDLTTTGAYYGDGSNLTGITATATPPSGADKEIQFNEAGSFGADDDFTYNYTDGALLIKNVRFHAYGTDNIFMGESAGNFTLTGTNLVGIGKNALTDITSGINHVAIGKDSLSNITTGNYNVAIGQEAGKNSVAGQNVFIGREAGEGATGGICTGQYNMGLAGGTLKKYSTGTNNIAIGNAALSTLTTGSYNTCIGNTSFGGKLTSTSYNVGIGYYSGRYSLGERNIFIGYGCGWGHTTANTGDYNVAIGQSAFRYLQSGEKNTTIGYKSANLITTGNNNTLIGYQAGDVLTTGSGNIIIGYDLDPSANNASNELNIGGILKGDVSAATLSLEATTTVTKSLVLANSNFSTQGPTDNVDVTDINILFIDTSNNTVTIGGLTGGVAGQILHIVKLDLVNTLTLEHNEGGGSQDLINMNNADEVVNAYGGATYACDGTTWLEIYHN